MRKAIALTDCSMILVVCFAAACNSDDGSSTNPTTGTAGVSAFAGTTGTAGSSTIAGNSGSTAAVGGGRAGSTGATAGVSGSGVIAGHSGTVAGTGAVAGTGGVDDTDAGAAGSTAGTAGALAAGSGAAGTAAGSGGTGVAGHAAGAGGAGQGGSAAGQAGSGAAAATFTDVYKIIMTNCAGSTCHVGATRAADGLSMNDKMTAYMNLVGANSVSCSGLKRVVAGDAMTSELLNTLEHTRAGTCANTPRMPDGKPMLSMADIDTVSSWITAGALNN